MIFYSSKHISSHQVATNVRKIRDQGSNFSHETECSDPKKLDFFETTLVVSFLIFKIKCMNNPLGGSRQFLAFFSLY